MQKKISYGRQNITDEDVRAVIEVLKSDFLTQGPKIGEFENKFSKYVNASFGVAVSNGTAGLHLAMMALGVKPGDKIITTPLTFVATGNAARYCGGDVDFVDIDPETYLIDIEKIREKLEKAPKNTYKGIVPVHFSGRPVNMAALRELADEFNCWLIEDACHAPGGSFEDFNGTIHKIGNGKFADLSVFSFHPVKHISTGEGGMITTNQEALYHKLLNLRTHGIVRNSKDFSNSLSLAKGNSELPNGDDYPAWYMEMQELGFNYRMTDFQAALGISQLKRANAGLLKRIKIAKIYNEHFKNKKYVLGQSGYIPGHAYHLYILEVENRLGLFNYLRKYNIYCQIHYIPMHLMPYYQQFGWKEGDFPNVENYYKNCISIPMYPTYTEAEIAYVIKKIDEFYE